MNLTFAPVKVDVANYGPLDQNVDTAKSHQVYGRSNLLREKQSPARETKLLPLHRPSTLQQSSTALFPMAGPPTGVLPLGYAIISAASVRLRSSNTQLALRLSPRAKFLGDAVDW